MSSLWSRVHKNTFSYDQDIGVENVQVLSRLAQQVTPVLVSLTAYLPVYLENEAFSLSSVDMTPCHQALWFEWKQTMEIRTPGRTYRSERCAVCVYRVPVGKLDMHPEYAGFPVPEGAKFALIGATWTEWDADPHLWSIFHVFIDADGIPVGKVPYYGDPDQRKASKSVMFLMADALTTMNTKGTRVEPVPSGKPVRVVKPDRAPCSVWHTIHIPRFAHEPLNAPASPEMLERREHWVRAHRADYRQGKGLFGRIHGLIWVPEHRRGNPELGTVKQSFDLQMSGGKA